MRDIYKISYILLTEARLNNINRLIEHRSREAKAEQAVMRAFLKTRELGDFVGVLETTGMLNKFVPNT